MLVFLLIMEDVLGNNSGADRSSRVTRQYFTVETVFNTKGLMSSERTDWKTPRALYKALDKVFHFDFDPCPTNPDFNGLYVQWGRRNYVNPPYGTEIKNWIKKAFIEAEKGKLIVMLIPSRTDTKYWHDYIMKAHEIWFIKGRLRFDDQDGPAPFPSAIVIFKGRKRNATPPIFRSVNILAQKKYKPKRGKENYHVRQQ